MSERTQKFYTDCAECIWAIKNRLTGKQDGCQFDRLEKWKEQGKSEELDSGFYRINTFCNYTRTEDWVSKHGRPKEELLDMVRIESSFKTSFITIITDQYDVTRRVCDLYKQAHRCYTRPYQYIFGFQTFTDYTNLYKELSNLDEYYDHKIKFYLTRIFDADPFEECVKKVKTTFFTVWESDIDIKFTDKVDRYINVDLKPLIMVRPYTNFGKHGLTVHKHAYSLFGSLENIELALKDQEMENMAINYEDL